MLWACKLLKLKEAVARVEGELEPEGEMIFGPCGECWGMDTLPIQVNSCSKPACYSIGPLMVLTVKKIHCLIGEIPKEEEDEGKEPESSIMELIGFNWARVWMEEGGSPVLE